MRLSKPRVEMMEQSDWDKEQNQIMNRNFPDLVPPNIHKTIIHHTKLMKRWMVFANHVLNKSSLPGREREMAILRTGWLCRAGYEWAHHVEIGKREGLTQEEIEAIKHGPDAQVWSAVDRSLLRAVEELLNDCFISDDTWNTLSQKFNQQQLMDIVFAVGNYNLVSMALNTFGVQLEEGYVNEV
ncbi:MAG: carboxymuconolactone decarboxylase family protein [Deltaproteobacteria bacterium]|nr:carboxymuconolactone decarboxylase family protein [Deltaproteobacteria bacterium]